tara:strand:+ start:343 stop:531 length:189 start_codon:yes stop_codon:yes gene_type:complete
MNNLKNIKMENQIEKLTEQVRLLTNEVEQLNTEISSLNTGDIWDGKIVDALNEIAKSLKKSA